MMPAPQTPWFNPTIKTFRCMPATHGVLVACTVVFALFNGASLFASMTAEPLFSQWLNMSQPVTERVADFVPTVQYATDYLKDSHLGKPLIQATRNCLSINIVLLVCFTLCAFGAACVDLATEDSAKIVADISERYQRGNRSIPDMIGLGIILLAVTLPLMYSGIATKPYTINMQLNFVLYYIEFFGLAVLLCHLIALSLAYVVNKWKLVE